jgi:hypothetical protein
VSGMCCQRPLVSVILSLSLILCLILILTLALHLILRRAPTASTPAACGHRTSATSIACTAFSWHTRCTKAISGGEVMLGFQVTRAYLPFVLACALGGCSGASDSSSGPTPGACTRVDT